MSERKTLLSRPRTKVYDCNYNIGEKYYKPMVDKLDRKYSSSFTNDSNLFGSKNFSTNVGSRSSREDDFTLHRPYSGARSFDLESLPERRTTSRLINGDAGRSVEEDLEEDIMKSMKKLKALRAARSVSVDTDDFATNGLSSNGVSSNTLNGVSRQKKLNFTSKILDSVGLNGKAYGDLEDEILKKRTVKIPSLFDDEPSSGSFTKWSKFGADSSFTDSSKSAGELAARARARQSKARLADIDNEIDAVAERGAARERRLNNIKALIAGEDTYSDALDSYKSKRISSQTSSTKKVSF